MLFAAVGLLACSGGGSKYATPTSVAATPSPTTAEQPAVAWMRVELPAAGISFEVPAGWVRVTGDASWGAPGEADACRQLTQSPPNPAAGGCRSGLIEVVSLDPILRSDPRHVLPDHFRALSTTSVEIAPLGAVTRYRGLLEGSAALRGAPASQLHIVVASERLFAGFSITAATPESLEAAAPLLEHLVRSVRLE